MLRIPSVWPDLVCRTLYVVVLAAFVAKEAMRWRTTGTLNGGKVLLLFATAAAWFTGIILFNGDLTFTLINIVSHGIPYMALIWIYQYRKRVKAGTTSNRLLSFFQLKFVPFYVLSLFALAYFEEMIWDKFVWREHADIFGPFHMSASTTAIMILVPLLTMPQVTHYVLDAFIWRVNKKGKEEVRAVIG
jgi:membrane protease YdiL (CAAX protease family)